jgi:hypothetical protein
MNLTELIQPWKDGLVSNLGIKELQERSKECIVYIQNRVPEAKYAKYAFDAEIRRQQEKGESDKLLEQVGIIDGRLKTVEQKAARPEICAWGFWFAVTAIIIAVCSWLFPRSPASAPSAIFDKRPLPQLAAPTNTSIVQSGPSTVTSKSSAQPSISRTNTLPTP